VNTDITDNNVGWIVFDGECAFCSTLLPRWRHTLESRGFQFVPLQTAWVHERLGLAPDNMVSEMKVLTRRGEILGGANAVIFLARKVWWAWLVFFPVLLLADLWPIRIILRGAYRRFARHRYCFGRKICMAAPNDFSAVRFSRKTITFLEMP
jgi:predicted DCC family thiol-disulfide oxidoreductase YuxK